MKSLMLASVLLGACVKDASTPDRFDNRAILYATMLDPKMLCYPLTHDNSNWPHTALCSLEQPDHTVLVVKCTAWLTQDPECRAVGKRAAPSVENPLPVPK